MLPEDEDLLELEDDDLLDEEEDDDDLLLSTDDELPLEVDPEEVELPVDDFVALSAGLLAEEDWPVAGLVPADVPEVPELLEPEEDPEAVPDLDAVALLMLPDLVLNEPLDTLVFGFTLLPGTCLFWKVPAE
ncbi:hypothetical protein D3C81_1600010 [compost metagenome]